MSIAYQFYADGFYAGECEDFGRPPNNSTPLAPPALPWTKKWPKFENGAWILVDDHRERKASQFGEELAQEATEYWLPEDTWQSHARKMEKPGPLPENAIFTRPKKPEPTISEKMADIDRETSASIIAGFDYEINGEVLHFSYDSFDQQNFADTANACLMAKAGAEGLPETVTWNAYRHSGELVRLNLSADDFLRLYAKGALNHKAVCMEMGGQKKAALNQPAI